MNSIINTVYNLYKLLQIIPLFIKFIKYIILLQNAVTLVQGHIHSYTVTIFNVIYINKYLLLLASSITLMTKTCVFCVFKYYLLLY